MDEFLQMIYLEHVKQECEQCFQAIQVMNAIIAREVDGDFFQPTFDLIHHAAAISRIFWPPGSKDKKSAKRAHRRGQFLRDLLGLKSGHPIQDRTLRDHCDHFDERLDEWAEKSRHKNIVDRLIGPRNAISGPAIQDTDIVRHYDPNTKIFAFRGEKFNIQTLWAGVDDIYQITLKKLQELEAKKRQQPIGHKKASG